MDQEIPGTEVLRNFYELMTQFKEGSVGQTSDKLDITFSGKDTSDVLPFEESSKLSMKKTESILDETSEDRKRSPERTMPHSIMKVQKQNSSKTLIPSDTRSIKTKRKSFDKYDQSDMQS